MSNILSRMPIIFEDENGNILPHRDSASNSYFDSANTGLNSDNVQDAIKEVNNKINNSSGNVANCNIVRLEDCEGYNEAYALDTIPTYNYKDSNDIVYTKAQFLEDTHNSELLTLAENTRVFLQNVVSNLNPFDILLFPYAKVFLLGFNSTGYQYGAYDMAKTSAQYEALSTNEKKQTEFYGLRIATKVQIDLNNSTLKAAPCFKYHHNMIDIAKPWYHNSVSSDTRDPSGTVIRNGKIISNRFELTSFPAGNVIEHCGCISATVKVLLEDLISGESLGDAIKVGSQKFHSWNTNESSSDENENTLIRFFDNGYINKESGAFVSNTGNGLWVSPYKAIEKYRYHFYKFDLVGRPYHGEEVSEYAVVDNTSYYVNEFYTVAYYKYNNNNSGSFISAQTIRFGDTLTIPEDAVYMRFSVKIDSTITRTTGPISFKMLLVTVDWAYGTIVRNCEFYDCGRDGITLSSLPNGLIQNCYIHDCDQDAIDIEAFAYIDKDTILDGIRTNQTDKGISCTTGFGYIYRNCIVSGIKCDQPHIIIDHCDLQWLILTCQSNSNVNISEIRRIVTNTVIRGDVTAAYTLFDNCVISGDFNIRDTNPNDGNYLNTFNNCVLKGNIIFPGLYNNCIIRPNRTLYENNGSLKKINTDLRFGIYEWSNLEQSNFIFKHCKIDAFGIYSWDDKGQNTEARSGAIIDIDSCEITINGFKNNQGYGAGYASLDARGSNFSHCYVKQLVNSIITLNTDVAGWGTRFILSLNLYNNSKINNNVFISPVSDNSKILRLMLNNIKANNTYHVDVCNNVLQYLSKTGDAIFVFVQAESDNDDLQIDVLNNAFVNIGDFVSVSTLPESGTIGVNYYNTSDGKFYTYTGETFVESDFGKIVDVCFDSGASSSQVDYVDANPDTVSAKVNNRTIDGVLSINTEENRIHREISI